MDMVANGVIVSKNTLHTPNQVAGGDTHPREKHQASIVGCQRYLLEKRWVEAGGDFPLQDNVDIQVTIMK
jgi:hypothetical protein